MFRWILPWRWGAGLGGSTPPIVAEGPYWVSTFHVEPFRVFPPVVRVPVVEPGRRWSPDPTLDTFTWPRGHY